MRLKAVVSYDGSCFCGFQKQSKTDNTVTGAIEHALESIGIDSGITGSGRTDSGVHASGQVIHFDLPEHWHSRPLEMLRGHINSKLDGVFFKHIAQVREDFHARFDAKTRIYRYIYRVSPSIFERKYISSVKTDSIEKLEKALSSFTGTHDFEYFRKTGSNTNNTVRTIYRACHFRRGKYNYIYFHADGFLRAQVRMMIEAAVAVSNGDISLEELERQLKKKERCITRPADPSGLYLARVLY